MLHKGCPISYAKFHRDTPSGSEAIPKKIMGRVASTPLHERGLTRILMGLWIFHHLMGWVVENPPCNSAPRRHSEKPKSAFGSSSESITKVFHSIFSEVNMKVTRGHQGSNLAKFHISSEMCHHLRKYLS